MPSERFADANDRPPLRSLPGEIWEIVADEWHARTWFGKLLYPLWITECLVVASFWLFFFACVGLGSLCIGVFESSSDPSGLPGVYKDE